MGDDSNLLMFCDRRLSTYVLHINIGARPQHDLTDALVTVLTSDVQRRVAVLVLQIWVRPLIKQLHSTEAVMRHTLSLPNAAIRVPPNTDKYTPTESRNTFGHTDRTSCSSL